MKLRKLDAHGFEHVFVMMLIVLAVAVTGTYLLVKTQADSKSLGVDISDPQCGIINSLPRYKWGVVGLNGHLLDFKINPCVRQEARHFDQYALYVGTNYPSHYCSNKLSAYTCGLKAGEFNIHAAQSLGLRPTKWWVDVEVNSGITWSTINNNKQFVTGMLVALSTNGHVGVYSSPLAWQEITGGMNLSSHHIGTWTATGSGKLTAAQVENRCSDGIGGNSRNQLVQYTNGNGIDVDVPC